jgi:hypothetical protein
MGYLGQWQWDRREKARDPGGSQAPRRSNSEPRGLIPALLFSALAERVVPDSIAFAAIAASARPLTSWAALKFHARPWTN